MGGRKEIFFATPRRPMWKEKEWDKAKRMQRGAIKMLLEFVGAVGVTPLKTTVGIWRNLLSRVIAVEGELRTSDNRLMGRLDMLFAEVDSVDNYRLGCSRPQDRACPNEKLKPKFSDNYCFTEIFFSRIIRMHLP